VLHNLRTARISLAYPKQDVLFTRRRTWPLNSDLLEGRIALLSSIDLFHQIEPEALRSQALNIQKVTFQSQEKVVTEGDDGNSMFIVLEGLLDVYVHREQYGEAFRVGHITSGQVFGETALLTGKPRSATVIASTDVVGYEITYQCMRELFQKYPEVMDVISQVFAKWKLQEQHFFEGIRKPEIMKSHDTITDELIQSIRQFFGLRRRHESR
jgi:branched-chain amino acid transport system substrate-binding protein